MLFIFPPPIKLQILAPVLQPESPVEFANFNPQGEAPNTFHQIPDAIAILRRIDQIDQIPKTRFPPKNG
jgi:hypothetical protein